MIWTFFLLKNITFRHIIRILCKQLNNNNYNMSESVIKDTLVLAAETIDEVLDIVEVFKNKDKVNVFDRIKVVMKLSDNAVELPMILMRFDEFPKDFLKFIETKDESIIKAFADKLNKPSKEVEDIVVQAMKAGKETGLLVKMIADLKKK